MQKSSIISAGRAALPRSLARSRPPLDIIVALLIVYVIWGSTYLAIRIALEGFPPFLMAAARFLIAGAVLYAILRLRGTPNPTRAQWRGAGLVGALLLLGGNGGVTFAEQWIPSGVAALAVATVPVWTAIFAVIWGQRPGRLEWLGVGVGFVGVVLLNFDGNMQANPFGAAVVLLSPICWALGTIWSRRVAMPPGLMASAAEMLVGGSLLLLAAGLHGEGIATLPGPRPLLALAFLIVFGSLIAFSAYGYLLARVRASVVTSYAYVNPAVAVGLGALLAGERVTLFGVLAMLGILAGVVLVTLGRPHVPEEPR